VKLEIAEYSRTKFEPEINRRPPRVTIPQVVLELASAGWLGADRPHLAISGGTLAATSRLREARRPPLQS
jgi:hypothetical protein